MHDSFNRLFRTVSIAAWVGVATVAISCSGPPVRDNPMDPDGFTYIPKPPVIIPAEGLYSNAITVSFAAEKCVTAIYYTIDGSTPSASSTRYSTNFTMASNAVVKAIAQTLFCSNSSVAVRAYVIRNGVSSNTPIVAAVTISPATGMYFTSQIINLGCATAGATIYYTTNGDEPTSASSVYGGPFKIYSTRTIRTIALMNGFGDSMTASSFIQINAMLAVGHQNSPSVIVARTSDWGSIGGTPSIGGGVVNCVAYSPNGSNLSMGYDSAPYLSIYNTSDWSAVSGTPTLGNWCYSVAYSPDGTMLAANEAIAPYHLHIFRTSDWTDVTSPISIGGTVYSIAFSPDGSKVAVGYTLSPFLKIYKTSDWSLVAATPTLGSLSHSIAFSPDGNHLAVSYSSLPFISIYNTSDWSLVAGTPNPGGIVRSVGYAPDGSRLAVGYESSPYLRVYNTSDWSLVAGSPGLGNWGYGVAFSPDCSKLAVGVGSTPYLKVFNTSDWSLVAGTPTLSGGGRSVVFSP